MICWRSVSSPQSFGRWYTADNRKPRKMERTNSECRGYRFGPFELDVHTGELRKHGGRVSLQTQPFQVLWLLLERAGELVARDDLRERLWPGDMFVDFDNGLNIAIRKLRQAFSDSAETPRY